MAGSTKKKSSHKGVYYREHETRKNGIRKDRYFIIRYTVNGKQHDEGYGWESEGKTEVNAYRELCEIKENIKKGKGFFSLKEKALMAAQERDAELKRIGILTYEDFFNNVYKNTYNANQGKIGAHNNHILPVIGKYKFAEILPVDIEKIKNNMVEKDLAPGTVNKILAYISHVINMAKDSGYYTGMNPIERVKKLKIDNRRIRFLSRDEANVLFNRLAKMMTLDVHDMALLALCCGFRAGEIFKLQCIDINFSVCKIYVRDPKGVINRAVPMPQIVYDMLQKRIQGKEPYELVFTKKDGGQISAISDQYQRIVDSLGFNDGITDDRNKVVFHTLRHTFASWLAMAGVDILTIKELMGHSDIKMTQRYMHLAPEKYTAAIAVLDIPLLFQPQKTAENKEVQIVFEEKTLDNL